jgi:hypothetical protein
MEKNLKGQVVRDNLAGKTFGVITILSEFEVQANGGCKWKYRCLCGREGWAWAEVIKRNPDMSCKECRKDRIGFAQTIHGKRYTRKYKVWRSMLDRCELPTCKSFKDYGGRGIRVCERWHDFKLFDHDVPDPPSPGLMIDRKDNNGHYEPGNVKWSTPIESMNNRRCNRQLTFQGQTHTWSEWSRLLGIDKTTIRKRALKGWPVEKILSIEDFRA